MVGWGKCWICRRVVELRDLRWSEILRQEACDDCCESAERGKLSHRRARGPVSMRNVQRGVDDHDLMRDAIRNGDYDDED